MQKTTIVGKRRVLVNGYFCNQRHADVSTILDKKLNSFVLHFIINRRQTTENATIAG